MKVSPTGSVSAAAATGHPYQVLAADLSAKIGRGELRPDERLPPIRALAKEYGVTIATAQRAVRQLAHDGLVRSVPNLGSFVLADAQERANASPVTVEDVNRQVDQLKTKLASLEERVQRLERSAPGSGQRSP